jgi:hypothetical protein
MNGAPADRRAEHGRFKEAEFPDRNGWGIEPGNRDFFAASVPPLGVDRVGCESAAGASTQPDGQIMLCGGTAECK